MREDGRYHHMGGKGELVWKMGWQRGWFNRTERKMKKYRWKEKQSVIGLGQVVQLAVC